MKKKIWLVVAVLAFLAAGVCILLVWKEKKDKEETAAMYQQMRQTVRMTDNLQPEQEETVAERGTEVQTEQEKKEPVAMKNHKAK